MFLSRISLLFLQIIVVATICPETAKKHHCCIASDLYPGKVLPTINRQHVEKFLQFHAPWTRQQDKYKKHALASTAADTQRTTHSKRKGKDYDFSFILLLLLLACCSAQRASCLAIMYQPWYHVSTTLLQNVLLLF